jgi:hypothetical protein
VLNNEYLRRIAEGIGGIVDPSSGKIDASKIEGVIPAANLPSYVDDVVESYVVGGTDYASDWLSDEDGGTSLTPESGKIYVIVSGSLEGTTWRWGGTAYVEMSPSYVLPTMSASTKGGAKLGDGLAITDGALGIDPEPQESTGEVRGAIASLTAKGWATQNTTTGKNLYHQTAVAEGFSEVVNNTNFVYHESHIFVNGTPSNNTYKPASSTTTNEGFFVTLPAGTYTASISGAPSDDGVVVRKLVDGVNQNVNNTTYGIQAYTFTLTEETKIAVAAACKKDVPHDNVTIGIQLEVGSTATSYEPHTGCLPSPSPDWPQPIKVAKGRNLVKTSRYKPSSVAESWTDWPIGASNTTNGITFTRNADGTITAVGTTPSNATASRYFELDYEVPANTNVALSGCPVGGSTGKYFMSLGATDNSSFSELVDTGGGGVGKTSKACDRVRIVIYSGQTVNLTFRPQLELGSTPTPYVPYGYVGVEVRQGSTLISSIPVPLPSKGFAASLPDGTADVLTIDGAGKVEWASAVGEVTFDGSSDETWKLSGGGGLRVYENSKIASSPSGTSVTTPSICTHFVATSGNNTLNGMLGFAIQDGRVNFSTGTGAMVVADWIAWLAQNPVTVLYPLATPITEQCGYIDWPTIPDGATITCPELDALGVRYLIGNGVSEMARQWYERAKSEYESRILALEQAVAELATS